MKKKKICGRIPFTFSYKYSKLLFRTKYIWKEGKKMLSKKIQAALAGSSAIRAMFMEGKELAAKAGVENVFGSACAAWLYAE